jgi:PPOX class probable F420-dependent enzyme
VRLSPGEARRRFGAAPVARLATADAGGRPHVVPVTFAADGDLLVTAVDHKPKTTRDLRRLRNIAQNPRVALLADHYSADWDALWWARADGEAEIRDSDPHALRLLRDRYPAYAQTPPEGPFVVIRVVVWSGWAARAPSDGTDGPADGAG